MPQDPAGRPVHVARKPVMAWALIHIPRPRGAAYTVKAVALAWTEDRALVEILWYPSTARGFERTWLPAHDVRRREPDDERAPADLEARSSPRPPPAQPEWPGPGP